MAQHNYPVTRIFTYIDVWHNITFQLLTCSPRNVWLNRNIHLLMCSPTEIYSKAQHSTAQLHVSVYMIWPYSTMYFGIFCFNILSSSEATKLTDGMQKNINQNLTQNVISQEKYNLKFSSIVLPITRIFYLHANFLYSKLWPGKPHIQPPHSPHTTSQCILHGSDIRTCCRDQCTASFPLDYTGHSDTHQSLLHTADLPRTEKCNQTQKYVLTFRHHAYRTDVLLLHREHFLYI